MCSKKNKIFKYKWSWLCFLKLACSVTAAPLSTRAERLIAFAIISRYEKNKIFLPQSYTVTWHARVMYDDRMTSKYGERKYKEMSARAVRLIEIEIKSRFEISKSLYSSIFFLRPRPNLPQYAIRTNQNAAEQNRPGIQTDSMLKKQGRWVQNRIRTWWQRKMHVACRARGEGAYHISFRAESVFLKILLRRSYAQRHWNAPLVIC